MWKISDIFYESLLEQEITKERWVYNGNNLIKLELDKGDIKKYNDETIYDSVVYTNKSESHLPGLYYLVL